MASGLLAFLVALLLPFAGLQPTTVSTQDASDCSDPVYALEHPDECGSPVPPSPADCSDPTYALEHPEECGSSTPPSPGDCSDPTYALEHPEECGSPVPPSPADCSDPVYALEHPDECGSPVPPSPADCSDPTYALEHPDECGDSPTPPVDNRPGVSISVPASAAPGASLGIVVTGTDDNDVSQLWLFDANDNVIFAVSCPGVQASCTQTFVQPAPSGPDATYTFKAKSRDSADQFSDFASGSGRTTPAPAPVPPPPVQPPPVAVDNRPGVAISVPPTAAPGALLDIVVTGTDDNDVSQLWLFDADNNVISAISCTGVQTTCTRTFARTAPSTANTVYTFRARSRDSADQFSDFATGSGITVVVVPVVPPPVIPPVVPPVPPVQIITSGVQFVPPQPVQRVVVPPLPLADLDIKPQSPLFMRLSSMPDSDCLRPGESGILPINVRNTGTKLLEDIQFMVAVPELGILANFTPSAIDIGRDDRFTLFFRLDVPRRAEEGEHYVTVIASNGRFGTVVHRPFAVGRAC